MNNINQVIKDKLCTSCGICSASCPTNAIKFDYSGAVPQPVIDSSKCTACGICLKCCPGLGVNLKEEAENIFKDVKNEDKLCGKYINAYVGYSLNDEIRYKASSGGCITSFLAYLLDFGFIDGAVLTSLDIINSCNTSKLCKDIHSVSESRGSKYLVTSLDSGLKELKDAPLGKYIVVCLPCQCQGIRKLLKYNKNLRDKVSGIFSLYCSVNKIQFSLPYYLKHNHVNKQSVKQFSFRTDGCLGNMRIVTDKQTKSIPYINYWHGTHSFFVNERCAMCSDHFGELADISFGDINIPPYNKDKVGVNSIVTRSVIWDENLHKAQKAGYIHIDNVPINDVLSSQRYSKIYKKGCGIQSYLRLRRFIGKKIPDFIYDESVSVSIKTYIKSFADIIMRWIGRHRWYWFINKFDKSTASNVENK